MTGLVRAVLCGAVMMPLVAVAQGSPAQKMPGAPEGKGRSYRLTYTITESDGGKRVGVQRYVLVDSSTGPMSYGEAQLKIGSKVPIMTGGTFSKDGQSHPESYAVQYLDVGLSIYARVHQLASDAQLESKVEQSSIIDAPNAKPEHPIIRQTSLSTMVEIHEGATVALGSLDIPGSTRHLDVEVNVQRVD